MTGATDPSESDADAGAADGALLSVRDLETHYSVTKGFLRREVGRVRAVDGVSFDLRPGEVLGLVGESGCGKSTVARTILGLESPTGGTVRFDGRDVTSLSKAELKRFRRRTGMVFQDPTSSFDPRMTVGESVAEPMTTHGLADPERRSARVASLFEVVGLSADDADRYPHELSGGQKQRAALARALSLNPDLLVLDEPISALDVSVQAEILELVGDLRDAFDLAILFISHDMSVVEQLCDRMAVMYLGELVERGPTAALFDDPKHPYTDALVDAIPEPDPTQQVGEHALSGDVPDPSDPPSGCRFHTRCPEVIPPDDADLPRSAWRAVFALRIDLESGDFGLGSLRMPDGDSDALTRSAVREHVREEYGIPEELPTESAEERLAEAVGKITAGETETAADLLADRFSTVCERDVPGWNDVDGRCVACHHYRPSDGANDVA